MAYALIAWQKSLIQKNFTGFGFWIVDSIFFIIVPLAIFFVWSSKNLQINKKVFESDILKTVADGLIMLLIIFSCSAFARYCYDFFLKDLFFWPGIIDYRTEIPKNGFLRVLIIMYLCVSAAVVEEWIFRFIPYPNENTSFGRISFYVAVSSLLFAIAHISSGSVVTVSAFFVGIGLSLGYVWRQSFAALVLAHMCVDAIYFGQAV